MYKAVSDEPDWPQGIELPRSDAHEWVDLATDGMQMWIRVEK